jgi:diguanylate cyclase (GGDEF)-like protein
VIQQPSRICRVVLLSDQPAAALFGLSLRMTADDQLWLKVQVGGESNPPAPGEVVVVVADAGMEARVPWIEQDGLVASRLVLPNQLRETDVPPLVEWVLSIGRLHVEKVSLRRLVDRFEERIKRDSGRVRMADLLQEANNRLQEQSVRDGLTGIPNRRRFEEHFDFLWGRAVGDGIPITLILSDIDFFKKLNDSLGHQAGDRCLQEVAHKLATLVDGEDDLVARYGGEEFVILLWDADRKKAMEVADILLHGVSDLAIAHPDHPSGIVTISLGVTCAVPSLTSSAEDFLHQADELLYLAKSSGRNRWEIIPEGKP